MGEIAKVLTRDEMKELYGHFYEQSPKLPLDRGRIPERFWPLVPYAEFWGIPDDPSYEDLLQDAPLDVQRNLKAVVVRFDKDLDEWLAGPEADAPPSPEYIAFSVMRLAAFDVR